MQGAVALCKVKLERFGSLSRLDRVLTHIRAAALRPLLGDGLGCVVLEAGAPTRDEAALDAHTVERAVFGAW